MFSRSRAGIVRQHRTEPRPVQLTGDLGNGQPSLPPKVSLELPLTSLSADDSAGENQPALPTSCAPSDACVTGGFFPLAGTVYTVALSVDRELRATCACENLRYTHLFWSWPNNPRWSGGRSEVPRDTQCIATPQGAPCWFRTRASS